MNQPGCKQYARARGAGRPARRTVKYVRHMKTVSAAPSHWSSTSPEREDVILMRDPFKFDLVRMKSFVLKAK